MITALSTVFRKSSRSHGTGGDCIEMAPAELGASAGGAARAMRDSKAPAANTMGVALAAWSVFTAAL